MKVAYVVYPDFTALDLVGPHESSAAGPMSEAPRAMLSATVRRLVRDGLELVPRAAS
jgi:hypothetical protein